MGVFKVENGRVVQVWADVAGLDDLVVKYAEFEAFGVLRPRPGGAAEDGPPVFRTEADARALNKAGIMEGDAVPGQLWRRGKLSDPAPDVDALRAAAELSRLDFARAVAEAGFVSFAEAAQWAAGNAVPAAVQAVIDALPEDQQGPVMLDVLALPTIRRTGALMPALATAFQADDAALDALFGIGVETS